MEVEIPEDRERCDWTVDEVPVNLILDSEDLLLWSFPCLLLLVVDFELENFLFVFKLPILNLYPIKDIDIWAISASSFCAYKHSANIFIGILINYTIKILVVNDFEVS